MRVSAFINHCHCKASKLTPFLGILALIFCCLSASVVLASDERVIPDPIVFSYGGEGRLEGVGVEHFSEVFVASAKVAMAGHPPETEEIAVRVTLEFCERLGDEILEWLKERNQREYGILLVRLQWLVDRGAAIFGVVSTTKKVNFTWDYEMPGCVSRI